MARAAFISPDWQRRARAVVIEAARKPIASLPPAPLVSDANIGDVVDEIISAWIMFRAEQAVVNGVKHDALVLTTGDTPEPWDMGTVAAILPRLALLPVDWSKPLAAWSREDMCRFICRALDLACEAHCARDRTRVAEGAEFSDEIPLR